MRLAISILIIVVAGAFGCWCDFHHWLNPAQYFALGSVSGTISVTVATWHL